MKCGQCKRNFPAELMTSITINTRHRGLENVMSCGLCALRTRNAIHGMGDQPFGGEIARGMFNDGRAHLLESGQDVTPWERSIEPAV